MSIQFSLTGDEELRKIFREFPENGYRKPIMFSFRKAALPVKKAMIAGLPASIKPMKKAIKAVPYKSKDPELGVGAFKKGMMYQNRRGQNWNPYMLIYWHNYGTLANRSSSHSFATARRKASASWRGGIKATMFMEKAWESSKAQAQKIFEETVDKEITKFFEKNAAK
jgi:hypothetical protein